MAPKAQDQERVEITTASEIQMRQIHPTWIHEGRVGSVAFRPFPKDNGYLSLHELKKISTERALEIYTQIKKLKSDDILGVSVQEINAVNLKVHEDPSEDGPSPEADELDAAHSSIDFTSFGNNQISSKSKTLTEKARDRKSLL